MEDTSNIRDMMEQNCTTHLQHINADEESQEHGQQRDMFDLLSKKFQTRDELIVHVRNFFYEKGYALSIKSSRKDKYVTIGCDLGGTYRNRHGIPFDKRKRKTSTRLRNCPFIIKGKKQDNDFWILEEKNMLHNYEASIDMSGHSSCRRLSKDEISNIETMSKSGIAPRHILTSLRQKNNSLKSISRTVYNAKAKIYRENLGCRTIIQALFEEFGKEKESEKDYVWALDMFKRILGDNIQPSVIVTDRELALMNAVRIVFPQTTNLLCVWHIEKNILMNCKRYFEVQDEWDSFLSLWNEVIYSSNEVVYIENWKQFEEKYSEKQYVINYIQSNWLPYREYFISAWTERHLHFGNRVSSRAEGAHAKLKRYLQVSTGDFRQLKDKICLAIENEFQEIKAQVATERLQLPHYCNSLFYKNLITHVSKFAMRQLHNQYEMIKYGKVTPLCKHHFMKTMGLPCAHKMMEWRGGMIPLESIHSQWRIDSKSLSCMVETNNKDADIHEICSELQIKYQQWPLNQKEHVRETLSQLPDISFSSYLEPTIQPHKGRPVRKRNSSTTERNPSSFEIVENARRCRICKGVGHNSRTCKENNVGDINSRDMNHLVTEESAINMIDQI